MRKFVVTGGPSTGKTSVILELEKRGFKVIHEIAREILNETKDFTFLELEKEIFRRQTSREICSDCEILFLDRGLPDILAYSKILLSEIPAEIKNMDFKDRYEAVFIMDKLDFVDDGIRYETKEEAEKVHKIIIETYRELGYKLIHVPVMPIEARTDFILEKIKS